MKKIIACLIVASAGMSFGCGGGGGGGTSAPPVGATITSVTPNTVNTANSTPVDIHINGSFNEPAGNWGFELIKNGTPVGQTTGSITISNVTGNVITLHINNPSKSAGPVGTCDIVLFSNGTQVTQPSAADQVTFQ
jgi:hypothetical protein